MKTKDRDRIRINTQMAEYLARGGKVKCCDHTSNASYGQPVKRTRKDQVAYTKKHNRIRGDTVMRTTPEVEPMRILRWTAVAKIIPISRSHAHALAAKGEFPSPVKIGKRASGWVESEIREWLDERIRESRA